MAAMALRRHVIRRHHADPAVGTWDGSGVEGRLTVMLLLPRARKRWLTRCLNCGAFVLLQFHLSASRVSPVAVRPTHL